MATILPFPRDAGAADRLAVRRVQAMAGSLSGTLRVARALALRHRRLALEGLQDDTGRLCAAVLDLPPATGRPHRAALLALRAELDALSLALHAEAAAEGVATP